MPSFLADIFSEPVTLDVSDTSAYSPPHRPSHEKPSSHSTSTTETGIWHLTNGNMVETPGSNKYVSGILAGGNNFTNSSFQSLPNVRMSESTQGSDRPNSGNEGGGLENGRKSPGPVSGVGKQNDMGQFDSLNQANGSATQPPRPKALESTTNLNNERQPRSRPHASSIPQGRHRRSPSVSNHQNPTTLTENSLDIPNDDVSPRLLNRYSSPPFNSSSNVASSSSPSILPHPSVARLQHRHTLQIPKSSGSRGSRDFSWANGSASEEAFSSSISPSMTGPRRGSLSLVRRTTQSIHSDVYPDQIPQDGDVARWTESIRQKRASRRKRKEDEEDDRVMVGTKVDMNHVNWVTAYNMLTGIRFTVSRTNAKIDRDLTDQDFDARHKFSFDITGNELTPSAKYDFKFKDYAPWVFRHLRTKFKLDPADYLISLTSKYILSELGSPGKSGSFFYFSRDYKYIIKTIHHAEHKLLRKILRDYYSHIEKNPNTLISQFYGLHRVKIPYGRKIHFVVMNNLFPPHRDIHQTFDLKGSTIGRDFKEDNLAKNPRATLKDLNWLRRNNHLEFGPQKKHLFIEQMEKDVSLLKRLKIMDYSLLVGIHDLGKGNEENLRDKTLQVFQPGVEKTEEPPPDLMTRTQSKLETARKARELRDIIKREKPIPMDQSVHKMPEEMLEERRNFLFYSDDGGFKATHENGQPGDEIYYLGIIDCLTHVRKLTIHNVVPALMKSQYGFIKRAEHFWKGMSHNKSQISPIPPEGYGDRFVKFITGVTMPREESEIRAQDHTDGSIHTNRPSSHYLSRSSTDRVIERAEKQAQRTEEQGTREDETRDHTLSVVRSPSVDRSNGVTGSTLPIVEEAGENSSTGERSARSCERELEAPLPVPQESNGRVSEAPPLGGKPPPTPPKDCIPRDKQLPSLPIAPHTAASPNPLSPTNH